MPYWKKNRRNRGNKAYNKNKIINKPQMSELDIATSLANSRIESIVKAADVGNKMEAHAVAIHSVVNRRTSSTFLTDVKDYSDPNLDSKSDIVVLSRKLRRSEGIASTVVDLLVDFAATRGSFRSDNPELQALLNRWADFVNSPPAINLKGIVFPVSGLREVARKIVNDYLVDGDAIFSLFWQNNIKIDPEIDTEGFFLPTSMKLIDILSIDIDEGLAQFGIERITLELDDEIIDRIKNPESEADKFLSKNIPKEWKKFITADEPIILDPNVTFHIKRNPKDYTAWGEGLLVKAFTAVANKRRLQAVDDETISGLINRFTIFKLGLADPESPFHIPSNSRVNLLADILTNPKRSNCIIWGGPDLDLIDVGPDGKILEFVEKYKQADTDILRALHVSPLLIDGGSSGQGVRDWAAFLSTEIGLDAIRNELEQVFTRIGKEIAITNDMQFEQLYYQFDSQLLKDEKRVRNFALKVYELGGISIETFVKTMGYNFETEKILKEREVSEGLDKIFVNRSLPFQGNPETIEPEGRPADTTNDDTGKESSPKTDDSNNTSASKAQVEDTKEFYRQFYKTRFDKMKEELIRKIKVKPDEDFLDLTLISGFLAFKVLVETQLKDVFYREVGIRANYDELVTLLKWNDKYIDGFYADMRRELSASLGNIDEFITKLDNQDYRVSLYAQESHRKAEFMGAVALARGKGLTKGKWISTLDQTTCPICEENHNKIFNINTLVNNFPAHPNCRCRVEFV